MTGIAFQALKDMNKTTNERGRKGYSPTTFFSWVEFFRAPDDMDNVRILAAGK